MMMMKTYIIGAILITIVFYLLLKKIGLIPDKDDVREDKAKTDLLIDALTAGKDFRETDIFDTDKYINVSSSKLLSEPELLNIATIIDNSWGFFNDDEDAIYMAFRMVDRKIQLSQLSDFYTKKFKRDLHSDIMDKMNPEEHALIWQIILNMQN